MNSRVEWVDLKNNLDFIGNAFINGVYQPIEHSNVFDVVSPIDNKVLTQATRCNSQHVEEAAFFARQAFNSGIWSSTAPSHKKRVLSELADLMEKNKNELALLETLDTGKPISHSLNVDIPGAITAIRWYAESVDKVYGEVAPTSAKSIATITHEPIGVVAAVVPWNFPLWITCWKLGPALAAGNSVILKPSEKSPLTGIYLGKLAKEAGIPDGVLQILPGFGHEVGEALAKHNDIDTIAFTGSTGTAKKLLMSSSESNMKRVWAEAGGKNANIVFNDCDDLDKAAEAAAAGCFYNQGEVCVAATRLLVHESIKDEFVAKVAKAARTFTPKDPLDPSSQMGTLIDTAHKQSVLNYLDIGCSEGAKVYTNFENNPEDNYVEPIILTDVDNSMRIAQEEIFGPILSVITFKNEEEAISIANDSIYGLGAAVWTQNIDKAFRVAKALRAGSVWINNYNDGDITVPFGGYKLSGNGRDKSLHAFDKFTETKTTWLNIK
jgi:gamma-glutamyl-gamma-aminobutyraldehyde dehydrogenase